MKIAKKGLKSLVRVMIVGVIAVGLACNNNLNTPKNNAASNNKVLLSNVPKESTSSVKNNSDDIDKNIYALSYDPEKILSFNGEKIENFVPAEGFEDSNKFVVVKREKKSI